jgi:NAD(P)-dependent dehydrogenase (short-subunit alcohol dehydrogenase family)
MEEGRKTVVITGASRGIGHAAAKCFLDRNWRIITCSRSDVPPECERDTNWTNHFAADLSKPDDLKTLVKSVNAALGDGPLHALVNNAGISPKSDFKERLGCLNGDLGAWREVMELNFYAALNLSRMFAAPLGRGKGAIVNVTSIAGHRIHPFAGSAYSISKAALSALTRELANEFAELDVRVNAVAPGEIKTDMVQPEYEVLIPRIPLGHMGTAEDVARTIHYLCSDDARYVTGAEIWVTGGQHMF